MGQAIGEVLEVMLKQGGAVAHIACPPEVIPAAGQYLMAHAPDEADSSLPLSVFSAGSSSRGFLAYAPWPRSWLPGTPLALRGPLGHGFQLPDGARRIALASLGKSPALLLPLLLAGLEQSASVSLLSQVIPSGLPVEVEVHPLAAVGELCAWADYLALELNRDQLDGLRGRLGFESDASIPAEFQVLVDAPMPCGGMAECGVCALKSQRKTRLVCKDGPVFFLKDLL